MVKELSEIPEEVKIYFSSIEPDDGLLFLESYRSYEFYLVDKYRLYDDSVIDKLGVQKRIFIHRDIAAYIMHEVFMRYRGHRYINPYQWIKPLGAEPPTLLDIDAIH